MRSLRRKISLFLVVSLLVGLIGMTPISAAEPVTRAVVIAASDFQNFEDANNGSYSGRYTNNSAFITKMFQVMGYETVDGFLFGGDYNFPETINDTNQTGTGVTALRNTVKTAHPELTDDRIITVQGNHDAANTPGINTTGGYDFEAYGVFAINEDDYPEKDADVARVRSTADKLKKYLDQKVEQRFDHPIFVVTHVPLHFNTRTQRNGDGKYAHYIFDLLNEYGKKLNIIFMFGHNHALGYDSYLGGASIFLTRGDKLMVAKNGSRSEYTEETLNFTYMNCGYTGYFWFNYSYTDPKTSNPPADSTLTMTSFEIEGNEVTIHRWDENGLHDLKSAGAKISKPISGIDYTDQWPANNVMYGSTVIVDSPRGAADLTALNQAIAQAEALKQADYSEASWKTLTEALKKAKSVTKNDWQEDADAACAGLLAAVKGLKSRAEGVDELIAAIGTVTLERGDAIRAARGAYNALSDSQKAAVTGLETLQAAEAQYRELLKQTTGDCGGNREDCCSAVFTDVPAYSNWAHKGIDFCVNRELLSGTGGTSFSPKGTMTRAMLVTVLWRYEGEPREGTNSFADVPAGKWYTDAVTWASANGVVTGVNSTTFNPNGAVTREQTAAILMRYYKLKNPSAAGSGSLKGFEDASKVGKFAVEPMSWALEAGVISGSVKGSKMYLMPRSSATRAEVAAMLMRFIQNVAEAA